MHLTQLPVKLSLRLQGSFSIDFGNLNGVRPVSRSPLALRPVTAGPRAGHPPHTPGPGASFLQGPAARPSPQALPPRIPYGPIVAHWGWGLGCWRRPAYRGGSTARSDSEPSDAERLKANIRVMHRLLRIARLGLRRSLCDGRALAGPCLCLCLSPSIPSPRAPLPPNSRATQPGRLPCPPFLRAAAAGPSANPGTIITPL